MEHGGDGDTNCNWCARNNPPMLGKVTGRLRNQRSNGNHTKYSIIKTSQNTEKSPGDVRRLAVTQTNASEKNSQGIKQ